MATGGTEGEGCSSPVTGYPLSLTGHVLFKVPTWLHYLFSLSTYLLCVTFSPRDNPQALLPHETPQTKHFKNRLRITWNAPKIWSNAALSLLNFFIAFTLTSFRPGKANLRIKCYAPHNWTFQWCFWTSTSSKISWSSPTSWTTGSGLRVTSLNTKWEYENVTAEQGAEMTSSKDSNSSGLGFQDTF